MDVLKKVPVREQEPKVRATNFEEVCYGYDQEEAMEESTRCINCKNAKCVTGCPVSINIPGFIAKVKEGNFEEAYQIISESSALPAVCGPLPPPELLDAMAARRAILAVRCPAHEALLTADNAMLVPADTRAVAAAVLRHLRAPFLCAEHAVAAAETVARERAYPRFAETVRRCYTLALEREEP